MEPLKITASSTRRVPPPEVSPTASENPEANIIPLNPLPQGDLMGVFIRERTQDKICHELALECDRLDLILRDCYTSKFRKPSEAAAIIARRVGTLKLLGERLDRVHDRDQVGVEISATARVLRLVKEVMRASGVGPETRELIYQSLIDKVNVERNI